MKEIDVYIEKYCKEWEIDAETAKTHAIVREVSKYYENPAKYNINKTVIKAGC